MGKFSRSKGKRAERRIATVLRERFPEIAGDIRRSIQSRQAEESDICGLPGFWLENQDAAEPTPKAKLEQAIRDVCANKKETELVPVAITHKTRSKSTEVTMRAGDLFRLFVQASETTDAFPFADRPVQIDFETFLDLVEVLKPWQKQVIQTNGTGS